MRAPAAKVETARQDVDHALGRTVSADFLDAPAQRIVLANLQQPFAECNGDLVGVQRHFGLQEHLAGFVLLADDGGRMGAAVELLLQLEFDEAAFLLDHKNLVEPGSELDCALRLQRPRHAHFVEPQAQVSRHLLRQVQVVECLQRVEVTLAMGDHAEPGLRAVDDDAVDSVAACKRRDRAQLVAVQPRFLRMRRVGLADVDAVGRERNTLWQRDLHAIDVDVDRCGRLHGVLDALDADPAAAEARHGPADDAVVEDFLDAGRTQHGNHRVDHRELALVAGGRRLAGVVVAHQHQHAAELRRAGQVTVPEGIAGAVDTGALAVPDRKDAVVLPFAADFCLLRAPHRRGRQVFVDARNEDDVVRVEVLFGAADLLVQGAQRGATITADVARGVVAFALVALLLRHRESHQRLRARDEDTPRHERVFVVQRHCFQSHGGSFYRDLFWASNRRSKSADISVDSYA